MKLMNGPEAEVHVGNCLPLSEIRLVRMVHNVELYAGHGGQMVRSAGNGAQVMAKEGKYATLRLPSGEMSNGSSELPRYHRYRWKCRAQPC